MTNKVECGCGTDEEAIEVALSMLEKTLQNQCPMWLMKVACAYANFTKLAYFEGAMLSGASPEQAFEFAEAEFADASNHNGQLILEGAIRDKLKDRVVEAMKNYQTM